MNILNKIKSKNLKKKYQETQSIHQFSQQPQIIIQEHQKQPNSAQEDYIQYQTSLKLKYYFPHKKESQDQVFELAKQYQMSKQAKIQNKSLSKQSSSHQFLINQQCVVFLVKKGYLIGDISVFEGKIMNLKPKQGYQHSKNIILITLSCPNNLCYNPESVAKILLKSILYLSQAEGMFSQNQVIKFISK